MILSFHPIFSADHFRLLGDRALNETDFYWMQKAQAIILPQHSHEKLFWSSKSSCQYVFPEYTYRYLYPGKTGQARLFQRLGLPHPKTDIFSGIAFCSEDYLQGLKYPVVLKSRYGSEGRLVFLIQNPDQAREVLQMLAGMEKRGFGGFLIQEWIQNQGRTLRVVVLGDKLYSYWRIQPDETKFLHNIQAGGAIDKHSDPGLQAQGMKLVRHLCAKTGINLAGVDVIFPLGRAKGKSGPLLLEINYYFSRQGLGGNDAYYQLLEQALQRWLQGLGIQRNLNPEY